MPKKTHVFLILLIISWCFVTVSAQEKVNVPKLDSLLHTLYVNNKAMGSLTISKGNQIKYSRGFGWIAEQPGTSPVFANEDTRYHIGSITKTFTAVMIMQLIEENKLKLSTPLSDFFPQVPDIDRITIRHMLNHHSGLYNFNKDSALKGDIKFPDTREEMMEFIVRHKRDFEPGEKGEYSNSNYVLLGYIIEKLTKSTYEAELKKRITNRLGLKYTDCDRLAEPEKNEAWSYNKVGKEWVLNPETELSIAEGAGSISSSSGDLCIFAQALFAHKLIKKESLQEMIGMTNGFGFGIFRYPFLNHFGYGHVGNVNGFTAILFYLPDDSVSVALTLNAKDYSINEIVLGALKIFYDMPYRIPSFRELGLSARQWKEYEGLYSSPYSTLKLRITSSGTGIVVEAEGQESFAPDAISEKEFRFDELGIIMLFEIEENGRIEQFQFTQGKYKFIFRKKS